MQFEITDQAFAALPSGKLKLSPGDNPGEITVAYDSVIFNVQTGEIGLAYNGIAVAVADKKFTGVTGTLTITGLHGTLPMVLNR